MKYSRFEDIMTPARMGRYLSACGGDTRKAMTLYRQNLRLSQEFFTVISCFEIALRNAIDKHYWATLGNDWLRNAAATGGIFDTGNCWLSQTNISNAVKKLSHGYTHHKLVAELGFGFWRYMFAPHQFSAAGRTLLAIFPGKPRSTVLLQYNQTYVFNQLAFINDIRNRIAHHEPVCFASGAAVKNPAYARQNYRFIMQLFQWMNIDEDSLLYGLDHIVNVCNDIDDL